MKKILLVLLIIFICMFAFGLAFMKYGILNPTINLIMIIVGVCGAIFTISKLCKKLEVDIRKRKEKHDKELETVERVVKDIKLKDAGTDVDELVEILKKDDIEIDYHDKN